MFGECHAPCTLKIFFVAIEKEQVNCNNTRCILKKLCQVFVYIAYHCNLYFFTNNHFVLKKNCTFDCSLFLEFNAMSNNDFIEDLLVVVQNKFGYCYMYQYLSIQKYDSLPCNIHINSISQMNTRFLTFSILRGKYITSETFKKYILTNHIYML